MKKNILQVVAGSLILGAILVIVFFLIGRFDLSVVWGALLGIACACLNFAFLALTVSKSLSKGKAAGGYMGISYLLRLAFIGAVVVFAIKSPYINYVAAVIPLLFPRVIITFIQGIMKWNNKSDKKAGDNIGGT
ncbi:MAG: ATP synthase subunit I [Clostridia bacterium]|nr:ATP synthase subunit I [Clostridia bacterium]